MMRPRSIRVIALALAVLTGLAMILGWDLVANQQVTDSFVENPGRGTLDF